MYSPLGRISWYAQEIQQPLHAILRAKPKALRKFCMKERSVHVGLCTSGRTGASLQLFKTTLDDGW